MTVATGSRSDGPKFYEARTIPNPRIQILWLTRTGTNASIRAVQNQTNGQGLIPFPQPSRAQWRTGFPHGGAIVGGSHTPHWCPIHPILMTLFATENSAISEEVYLKGCDDRSMVGHDMVRLAARHRSPTSNSRQASHRMSLPPP